MEALLKRNSTVDIAKGIGIILVFLGHSFHFPGIYITGGIEHYIWSLIYSFHMPLFFFISGLLSNTDRNINLNKFYVGKLKRLAVPYLVINLIDFVPRTLFPSLVNSKFGGIKEVLFYGTKISWFVYTLFIIFMIFPFLDKWILKKDKYYFFGIFLIILNYFKIFEKVEIFSLNVVVEYSIYFYLGYIIKPFYKEKIIKGIGSKNTTFLGIGGIFLVFSYKYFYLNLFNNIVFALLGILFVLNISLRIKEDSIICNFFKFCGINSLSFYLIEGFIAVVYRVTLVKIIPIEYRFLLPGIFFILKVATAYIVVKLMIVRNSTLSFLLGASAEK